MRAILDDDEDLLAGNTVERTVVVNPREIALQTIEDGRIRKFELRRNSAVDSPYLYHRAVEDFFQQQRESIRT